MPSVTTQKTEKKKTAPKTGDQARTGLFGIMTMLGALGAGLSLKKKEK